MLMCGGVCAYVWRCVLMYGGDPLSASTDPLSASTDPLSASTDPLSASTDPLSASLTMISLVSLSLFRLVIALYDRFVCLPFCFIHKVVLDL